MDGQIGLEDTPDEWVARLVAVFREVRRVLRDDGTLWVEIGDSYNTATSASRVGSTLEGSHGYWANPHIKTRLAVDGLKPKDLLGQPWLLAFALRADGWYLRQCIIWHKPNCMPESATDRCTTAHSYIFLLSKSARYWFDADAIAEPAERGDQTTSKYDGHDDKAGGDKQSAAAANAAAAGNDASARRYAGFNERWKATGRKGNGQSDGQKNPRSVWTIPTRGYPGAHFATWPAKLVRRMILAGCPAGGVVLDPFGGTGTTALAARELGCRSLLIELNHDYCRLAAERLAQQSLLFPNEEKVS